MIKTKSLLIIFFIFLFGLSLRLYGLDWDQGQHLHPDERFLTMVLTEIQPPSSLSEYFNTSASPLNPHNYPNYQFFVYGTFPLFTTKLLAVLLNLDNYQQIVLLGRVLSAFSDSLIIIFLFFISKHLINPKSKYVYLASFLYAVTVLPIQLSHFFAVDTFLNLFLVISLYFSLLFYQKKQVKHSLLSAVFFGLALSSKISALYFTPLFAALHLFSLTKINLKNIFKLIPLAVSYAVIAFLSFRIFQPYAFVSLFRLNPLFLDNLKTLQSFSQPDVFFPPSIQWLSITPFLFPLKNMALWGLGLPISITFIFYLVSILKRIKKSQKTLQIILIIFTLFFLVHQGSQFTPALRYFLPIYPIIILLSSNYLFQQNFKIFTKLVLGSQLIWAFCFLSIYSHPHTRVQASQWIYQNIPAGSVITNEYWDDPLPLYLSGQDPNVYQGIMLPLYDPDDSQKWSVLKPQIDSADYIIMSSNRLWGSIPKVPHLYPQTSQYYQDIFSHQSNFKLAAKFVSYPGISLPFLSNCYYFGPTNYPSIKNSWFEIDPNCNYPGVYLRDDTADESFTVYDHPQVLIFSATTIK